MPIPLQSEALSKFSDYGLPGLVILMLLIAVGYLFKVVHNYSTADRKRADQYSDAFMNISRDQNETNRRIVEVTEKIADQGKLYHDDTTKRIEELPSKIFEEFEYRQLKQGTNKTPAQ